MLYSTVLEQVLDMSFAHLDLEQCGVGGNIDRESRNKRKSALMQQGYGKRLSARDKRHDGLLLGIAQQVSIKVFFADDSVCQCLQSL